MRKSDFFGDGAGVIPCLPRSRAAINSRFTPGWRKLADSPDLGFPIVAFEKHRFSLLQRWILRGEENSYAKVQRARWANRQILRDDANTRKKMHLRTRELPNG